MSTQTGPDLLVDGRNIMYRAVYAGLTDRRNRAVPYHFFVIFLRQFAKWIDGKKPQRVHVFWDAPRDTVWRRKILPTYKDRSSSNYVEGLGEHLARTTAVAQDFFKVMGVRQYERPQMEADDLIYAAVSLLHPRPTWIVSGDSDMRQIPYRYHSCSIFDPDTKQDIPRADISPVHMKALTGDKSDTIDGYFKVGPVTARELVSCPIKLNRHLEEKGADIYHRNLLLIDLSLCPRLLANSIYAQKVFAETVTWDRSEIRRLTLHHKVNGIDQEFESIVLPFKNLV